MPRRYLKVTPVGVSKPPQPHLRDFHPKAPKSTQGDAKKGGRSPLDQPPFGEAEDFVAGDDQVIEHPNVDES